MPMPSRNSAGPIDSTTPRNNAPDHRPGNVADAAQHRRAERLDARQEAREEVNLLVDETVEDAADARPCRRRERR